MIVLSVNKLLKIRPIKLKHINNIEKFNGQRKNVSNLPPLVLARESSVLCLTKQWKHRSLCKTNICYTHQWIYNVCPMQTSFIFDCFILVSLGLRKFTNKKTNSTTEPKLTFTFSLNKIIFQPSKLNVTN